MLHVERPPSPCFDEGDLSKDFGLDITVSDGGLVTSAANQRQYQAECSRIYQQFILNMTDYISEEAQLRKTLTSLHSQKKKPQERAKPKRAETPKTPDIVDEDAFSAVQLEEFKNILARESCRSKLSHASGFATMDGPNDGLARSQTPKPGQGRSVSSLTNRPPVTHMFPALKERPPSVKATQLRRDSKSGANNDNVDRKSSTRGNHIAGANNEYDGIMENNTDFSSNRRIRMNPRAFTRLMTGQVKVKLLNKNGEFVLTPVSSDTTAALSQEENEKQVMDSKEKIALVKQRTTFQSPTLSSDLKISNLVAIQKALKGQSAKRITVGEVMKSARDRKARLFRVQVTGNRFDEFDQKEEDLGFVHEVKAATDLGDDVDARPTSRMRFSPHINMLRQSEQRPESRLRSPTPIPLHVLDPSAVPATSVGHGGGVIARSDTPGIMKQVSTDFSGLAVHKDCSDFEHRYSQAVDQVKFKEKTPSQMSVIQLDFDETDSKPKSGIYNNFQNVHRSTSVPPTVRENKVSNTPIQSGVFPVSRVQRAMLSKSAAPGRESKAKKRVEIRGVVDNVTSHNHHHHLRPTSSVLPECPVKRISSMRDTACIVKRWQEDDKSREEKLNRWRMRMSFAATRRGNLAKVLTRTKSGR